MKGVEMEGETVHLKSNSAVSCYYIIHFYNELYLSNIAWWQNWTVFLKKQTGIFWTGKHWQCDEKRNQRKSLSARTKLLRQRAETNIWSDGKRLLSSISEIRNLPSSPGSAMKEYKGKEEKLVRQCSEWLMLHFSRLTFESTATTTKKRVRSVITNRWEGRCGTITYVQVLAAKHDVNNIEAASVLSFLWIALCYGGKKPTPSFARLFEKSRNVFTQSRLWKVWTSVWFLMYLYYTKPRIYLILQVISLHHKWMQVCLNLKSFSLYMYMNYPWI